MIVTTIYLPIRGNDGKPFDGEIRQRIRARLVAEFGSYSINPGQHGAWTEQGTTYRDESEALVVALASWLELPRWFEFVRFIQTELAQISMYIEIAGIPEVVDMRRERKDGLVIAQR